MTVLPVRDERSHGYCHGACHECDYYLKVHGQRPNVLAVTSNCSLKTSIKKSVEDVGINYKATDCEYRCSMLIDRFRPDYAIIDTAMGVEKSRDFIELLYADPRLPLVRIMLIGEKREMPLRCDKMIFAIIDKHFNGHHLLNLINSSLGI